MDHKQVLNSISTAVSVISADGKICSMNSAAEHILEISANRAIGQYLSQIAVLPEGLDQLMSKSAESLQPFTQRESVWIIHDHAITLDLVATPVIAATQSIAQFVVLELHVVDRIIKISRDDRTHHSHQAHRALIRGLAHEVKNPLGAIRGATQLLQRCLHEEYHEYTKVIIEEVDRLSKLVDSMLGPRTPLDIRPCNVHEIIERVLNLVTVEAVSQNQTDSIKIKRNYDLSLPEFNGDGDRLIQAFLNIVTNARQALLSNQNHVSTASSSTHQPTISITTQIQRQMTLHHRLHRLVIHVCIADNGPGIPEDIMMSLFYPLVSGRAEGSGIGLSVAQHVIQLHGGIVECNSQPGLTEFHLYIPSNFLPLGEKK